MEFRPLLSKYGPGLPLMIFLISIFLMAGLFGNAQYAMRPLSDLVDTENPAWPLVKGWIDSAKNKVEVLPAGPAKGMALYKTQVTTHSPMGSVIYYTGGLLVDHGWIRILGSGSDKMKRTLPDWNKGRSFREFSEKPTFLLVADDVLGGFFMINGGALGNDPGKMYYLSPFTLKNEPLEISYSQFLDFCFNGDLNGFYKGYRWAGWEKDVQKLGADNVFSFYPFLWTKEGTDLSKTTRTSVSASEQYDMMMISRKQLGAGN